LTSDGELTNRLTHPRHEIPKIYRVRLVGQIPQRDVEQLAEPMEINGYRLRPVGVKFLGHIEGFTEVVLTLYEGRNRQIRKMCEKLNFSIARLTRVAIGDLKLGTLPKGKWRHLTQEEVQYLYERSAPQC
jgi:pseudouridine synthase